MLGRFTNMLRICVVAADCPGLLSSLHAYGVCVYDVERVDDLTLHLRIAGSDLRNAQMLVEKRGGMLRVLTSEGPGRRIRSFFHRPVLLLGLLLIVAITVILPTRVLFIEVEGDSAVPEALILECARSCGVGLGVSRRELRSEGIKNKLLQMLPQLEWVGVNTYGCRAVISVTEREPEEETKQEHSVSSIIAARDGVISSCTVTSGNLICKPGQAVRAGQTLVSGYTDCGITIRATRAEGEIYAQTLRSLKVMLPTNCDKKGETKEITKKYSLIVGKKRINFYKDSGILDTTCDKMYTEYVLTLPGGFQLPVVLLVQTQVSYALQQTGAQIQDASEIAEETARAYLQQLMISGTILNSSISEEYDNGAYVLVGKYRCMEMIGRVHSEEILDGNGEDN